MDTQGRESRDLHSTYEGSGGMQFSGATYPVSNEEQSQDSRPPLAKALDQDAQNTARLDEIILHLRGRLGGFIVEKPRPADPSLQAMDAKVGAHSDVVNRVYLQASELGDLAGRLSRLIDDLEI